MIREIKITQYQLEDGRIFTTKDEAEKAEHRLEIERCVDRATPFQRDPRIEEILDAIEEEYVIVRKSIPVAPRPS